MDSNVVAHLYLPGDCTDSAEALLEKDADWAAPLLWRGEFRNILAGYLRRRILTFEAARELQIEAESLLAGAVHEVDSRLVLELVRDSDCSAYDCEFVALAMTLGVKLATEDKKLLRLFRGTQSLFLPADMQNVDAWGRREAGRLGIPT